MGERNIKYIVVHCTAGNQKATERDVLAEFKRKGWKRPGYHYLVTADGKIHSLTAEAHVANGVYGYNRFCVHVAYTGGMDGTDTRTGEQKAGLRSAVRLLHKKYPDAVILGHHDFPGVKKTRPNFDAKKEYINV